MKLKSHPVALAVLIALVLTQPLLGRTDEFRWQGIVESGLTVEIKGVNGNVEAIPGGGEVEVRAAKSGRRSDPAEVQIEVILHEGGVTICAVYPSTGRPNECRPGSGGRMNVNNNDVTVDFTVSLPAGVNFIGRTVNGDVTATSVVANVEGFSVNGNLEISCEGLARARTVNGSITAAMASADWDDDVEFETVNGSITLELPGDLNADVEASSVTGGIHTEYPLTVQGRWGPKKISGKIGSGGQKLEVKTVNGSIELLRGGW